MKGPFTDIVKVMFDDIDDNEEYLEAMTNIFVESMKGPGRALHSKSIVLFNDLFQHVQITGWSSLDYAYSRVDYYTQSPQRGPRASTYPYEQGTHIPDVGIYITSS